MVKVAPDEYLAMLDLNREDAEACRHGVQFVRVNQQLTVRFPKGPSPQKKVVMVNENKITLILIDGKVALGPPQTSFDLPKKR